MRYDVDLKPMAELSHLYDAEVARTKYPAMTAHEKLIDELRAINLTPKQSYTAGDNNNNDEDNSQVATTVDY